MLIHVGQKHARRFEGWVPSFCPICRSVRAHEVNRLILVPTAYGVSTGNGREVLDELTCRECGVATAAEIGAMRGTAMRDTPPQTDRLDRNSYPWPFDELEARLALEQRARAGEASPAERVALLREPIDHLTYQHRQRMVGGPWVSVMAVVLVLALGSVLASVWLLGEWNTRTHPPVTLSRWTFGVGCAAVLFTALCTWLYIALPRLTARSSRALIARSLETLKPQHEELTQALRSPPLTRTSPARGFRAHDFAMRDEQSQF